MEKKKAGRPKVLASERIVPVTVGVPAKDKKELLSTFKRLANERKRTSIKGEN
jgi:hypothetical protein